VSLRASRPARSGRAALVLLAALALSGCVIPSPPQAAPVPTATATAQPVDPTPAPSQPVARPTPTQQQPTQPAPTAPTQPEPTQAECAAADEALAAIVTRATEVLDAVPADGEPDWAAADAVVADLPVMRDAFIAETTSPALAESFHELDQGIADLTEAVSSRDDLIVTISSAAVALRAPAALLPCAGIL
jgi:hypothetical protein